MPARSPRTSAPLAIPERAIQSAIIQYLRIHGWYAERRNAGAWRDKRGHVVRMAPAGTPDLWAIKDGASLFVEVKRPGEQPTERQEGMMATLERYGARCIVATGVEDLERQLGFPQPPQSTQSPRHNRQVLADLLYPAR